MKRILFVPLLCVALSAFAFTDDEHGQHHHEGLTDEQLGSVHFPVTCAASVQKPFERGIALLHSFWYEEAQKQFEQIAGEDPRCAMAHWGIALSLWHQLWNQPDEQVIQHGASEVRKAKALEGNVMPREKAYISAIASFYGSAKVDHLVRAKAYSDKMKKVYDGYPDDHEGAAFYALSLLASEPHDDTTFANRKQAAAVLEKLFAIEPDHPGVAHYLIHSYDKPQLAHLGLPAARRYAEIAPASPHALHMPSHIFARVGLWQDDINSNLASIAATRKTAAMHMGGEDHQFHAMDFLFYAYMQSGRDAEAKALIDEIRAMPHQKNDMYGKGYDPHMAALAHLSALYPIEMRDWAAAAALPPMESVGNSENASIYWARAIGAAHLRKADEVRKDMAELNRIHQALMKEGEKGAADIVSSDEKEAQAWLAFADGKLDDAVEALRPVADREEAIGDEPEGIPAREMIAEILMEAKRPQQALTEYQADLKNNPNRFNGLYGAARAAEAAGKQTDAMEYYALLLKVCDGSNSTRPELTRAGELVAKKQ